MDEGGGPRAPSSLRRVDLERRSLSADPRLPAPVNAFGPAAADYERARPTYPAAAVDHLRRQLDLRPGRRVCDLAAGTGKLTRLLVATGAEVVAVEPVPGMREQLRAAAPDVEVLDGTAEAMPFPDGSLDAVTVAQAFHWFRFDEALAEIRRVLRAGGGLGIVFNERDARVGWVARWNEVLAWHSRTVAAYQATDWTGVLEDAGFGATGGTTVEWSEELDRGLLAARVRSVSYVAEQPEAVQDELAARVVALVEDEGDRFDLPYVTHVWWGTTPR